MEAMDVMVTVIGPLTLSMEQPSCHYLSYHQIPNLKSEAMHLGWLDQVFLEPITYKMQ